MGVPQPARSSSPACSPRPASTTPAGRSAMPAARATWPPSHPRKHSARWSTSKRAGAAPTVLDSWSCSVTAPPGSFNLTSLHFPNATGIVDLYHAREHLHELAKLAAPALDGNQRDWLTDRLDDLDRGDIDAITTATRALELPDATTDDIDQALGYSTPTGNGCATPTSENPDCSSAPARSRPVASPSSANASNSPACAGTSPAPPASSPCAVTTHPAAGTSSGPASTTPPAPPDPTPTYKSGAHPWQRAVHRLIGIRRSGTPTEQRHQGKDGRGVE